MKIKIRVIGLMIVILMAGGFYYWQASAATNNNIAEAFGEVASIDPLLDKAIRDWADNQRIDNIETKESLKNFLIDRDQKENKNISDLPGMKLLKEKQKKNALLIYKLSEIKSNYPKYDLGLLAVLYSGFDKVNVIVELNDKDKKELDNILDIIKTDTRVEVRYDYMGINVIALRNISVNALKELGDNPAIKNIHLTRIYRLEQPKVKQVISSDWDVEHINAEQLWNKGYRGEGVNISIIDTGIDINHPDLNDIDDNPVTNDPKVIASKSFVFGEGVADIQGHGTHVAGIAAGTGEASNYDYMGIAPKAFLLNAKVVDSNGDASEDDVIAAIDWSVNKGADIISMSLGFPGATDGSSSLSKEVDWAVRQGVIVVVAAGNDGQRDDYPYISGLS